MTQYRDILKIRHNSLRPQKGRVLVSEPFLQNVYFQRAVILLLDHGMEGTAGLVVNKRTSIVLNDFFPELKKLPAIHIYMGGPVRSNHLIFIHSLAPDVVPGGTLIGDNLYFGGDMEMLKNYLAGGNPAEGQVKFFLGYSGWESDQLNKEIAGNSWLVSHSSAKSLLLAKDDVFWKQVVFRLGDPYRMWLNYPKFPEMN
jgi:putative transcriptional regulator